MGGLLRSDIHQSFGRPRSVYTTLLALPKLDDGSSEGGSYGRIYGYYGMISKKLGQFNLFDTI